MSPFNRREFKPLPWATQDIPLWGWILIIVCAGLLIGIAIIYFAAGGDEVIEEPDEVTGEKTNFVATGTITVNNPGMEQGALYVVYEEPGSSALTKKLTFDAMSVCATQNGATPCMAMSVTLDVPFGGKRAVVEGVEDGQNVLVRKLYAPMEGAPLLAPEAGRVFISWPQAVRLMEQCRVAMITQTHAFDVQLALKEGGRVIAVEPFIDEIFNVHERTQAECGTIPVATE